MIIIGAGWAGVAAAKHAVADGFQVIVLEKRDNLGGIWYYSDDPEVCVFTLSFFFTHFISRSDICAEDFLS